MRNMSVGRKIALGFALVLLLLAITATLAFMGIGSMAGTAADAVEKNALIENLKQKEIDHLKWASRVTDLLTDETVTTLNVETDPHKCGFGQWYYGDGRRQAEAAIPEIQGLMREIEAHHTRLHASAIDIGKTVAVEGDAQAGRKEAARIYSDKTRPALEEVQRLLGASCGAVGKVVEHSNAEMAASAAGTRWKVGLISVAAIVLGTLAAAVIGLGISRTLRRVIDGLSLGAEQVSAAAGQVSSASQQLAEGSSEQASSLEETSSSLEEMASMSKQNAGNAKQANALASDTMTQTEQGSEAMGRMSDAIGKIKQSADETARIIKVIDEIAFQTNLLALNAAVEAARAGEAGKGFAVVAEEVRNLAQRSAEAAKNTAKLIEESQKNTDNGVKVTEEVTAVLGHITEGVKKVTDLMGEVAAASDEQSRGVEQINVAVGQMDQVTQQVAANAEESAAAGEELNSQADELNRMVNELAAMVGGRAGGASHTAARSPAKQHHPATHAAPHPAAATAGRTKQRKAPAARAAVKSTDPEEVIPLGERDTEAVLSEF